MPSKSSCCIAIALAFASACIAAQETGTFQTAMSFQTGALIYPQDGHSEAYASIGFETSGGPLFLWTGLGGTMKIQGDNSVAFVYPWMLSALSVPLIVIDSGILTVRPVLTLPWSTLSYKAPGIGLIVGTDGHARSPTSFSAQLEAQYFPPLFANPWYDDALLVGMDFGAKYWMAALGGYVKLTFPSGFIAGFDGRIEFDNHAYNVGGAYYLTPNAEVSAIVELPGISFRAGISLNGWNTTTEAGVISYVILPNLSIILGRVPFFM